MALIIGGQPQRPLRNDNQIGEVFANQNLVTHDSGDGVDHRHRPSSLVGDGEEFAGFDPGGGDGAAEVGEVFERRLGGGSEGAAKEQGKES